MIGKVTMPSGIVVTLEDNGKYTVTLPEGMPEKYESIVASLTFPFNPRNPGNGDGSWHLNYFAAGCSGVVEFRPGFQPRPEECQYEAWARSLRKPPQRVPVAIGRVTTEDGLVLILNSNWSWEITGPEDMPPELSGLIKRDLESTYTERRPQDGKDTWPLELVAALYDGTVEIVPGRDHPSDGRVY